MARVVYAEEFSTDLRRQVEYLRRLQEFGWIRTLREDLDDVAGLLSGFPLLGTELTREGTETLRKLRLRRAPFFLWHSYDEAAGSDGPMLFLRLFHTRQKTPAPRLP